MQLNHKTMYFVGGVYTVMAVTYGMLRVPNWTSAWDMLALAGYSLWVASLQKRLENK